MTATTAFSAGNEATTVRESHDRKDLNVLNVLKHPVWIFDIEKKSMFWANVAALAVWGAESVDTLLARDFASDMSENTEKRLLDQLSRMKRGEIMKEQWTVYPNGKARTLHVAGSVIYIDGGRAAILFESELLDRTDFDKSSTREIEMLRHVPISVSQFDMKGNSIFQNPEDIRVFGSNRAAGAGNNKNDFLHRFVDKEVGKSVLGKIRDDVKDLTLEAEHYVTEGPPRWFSIAVRRSQDPVSNSSSSSSDQEGDKEVILYSARDITEIMQARRDTTKAKLKSEFMSVIAHELRTPLHQIVGYTDLLEFTSLTTTQLQHVKLIQRSTESLMAIINDLLDYSAVEAGKCVLENIHFKLTGVLDGCGAAVEAEAAVKGIDLKCNFAEDLPNRVIGDANKLRQVLLNLLQNAVKFTEEGSVSFAVYPLGTPLRNCATATGSPNGSRHTQWIRFEVADTGIGIDETHLEIIFEKYQQAHNAISRNYGGTGLGLSISRSLVEAMNGRIGLKSKLGSGTTFFVEVPLVISSAEEVESSESSGVQGTGECTASSATDILMDEPLHVLVVEDNKMNQKLVQRMLQKMGHTVRVADNGQIALDMLASDNGKSENSSSSSLSPKFDFVLMDIQMPVMDGIEATKLIRTRLRHTKITLPVVGLTASFQHTDLHLYLEIGMNTCLSKPVRLDTLRRAIQGVRTKGMVARHQQRQSRQVCKDNCSSDFFG